MMEIRQETDYVVHHAQKILAIFAAMREFCEHLRKQGHELHYLTIDDPINQQRLDLNLAMLFKQYSTEKFEYQEPDEWRLDQHLLNFVESLRIPVRVVGSDHFGASGLRVGEVEDFSPVG